MSPYNIKIIMPCFMVMDGKKTEIDEDFFEQMSEKLHQPKDQNSRWKPDGTYDKKTLDPDYFKHYYQTNLKTPIKRPDCGKTITSKSNHSKHRQTNICKNNRDRLWKCQTFSIRMIFIENVCGLNSNPKPRNSDSRPKSKNYLKKKHLI